MPSSAAKIGIVQPHCRIDAAICSICSGECRREFRS
jgi:hypothetical protein